MALREHPRQLLIQVNATGRTEEHHACMKLRAILFLSVLFCFWVTEARADIGLPMIFVSMQGLLAAIIPIILIETPFLRSGLGMTWGRALQASSLANLASTFVGIPLAWVLLAVLEMLTAGGQELLTGQDSNSFVTILDKVLSVTIYAPWIVPYENWQIPAAQLALLVPFFFATWWVETNIVMRSFKQDYTLARRACLRANLTTYALLAAITVGALVWTLTPSVSRQEFGALKAAYGDQLEALPKILSTVRVGTMPIPHYDPNCRYCDEFVYRFDASAIAEIREMVDCSKIHFLAIEADDTTPPYDTEMRQILICDYEPPNIENLGDGFDIIGRQYKRPGLDMSDMIRERQTDYGQLSVGTAGYPPLPYYAFDLERESDGIRYSVEAVFAQP